MVLILASPKNTISCFVPDREWPVLIPGTGWTTDTGYGLRGTHILFAAKSLEIYLRQVSTHLSNNYTKSVESIFCPKKRTPKAALRLMGYVGLQVH